MADPRGKLTTPQVLAAHREHLAGWSIRRLAILRYREWGYKTPDSAARGLRQALLALDLPIRSQREATRAATTVHGHCANYAYVPGAPDHHLFLKHRRRQRPAERDHRLEAAPLAVFLISDGRDLHTLAAAAGTTWKTLSRLTRGHSRFVRVSVADRIVTRLGGCFEDVYPYLETSRTAVGQLQRDGVPPVGDGSPSGYPQSTKVKP